MRTTVAWLVGSACWLGTGALHAALAPLQGGEISLGRLELAPSNSVLSAVSVATEFSKQQSLLVWVDDRPGDDRTMTVGFSTGAAPVKQSIYAARVAADGTVIDAGGILVARYRSAPTQLRVAGTWNGYEVVWSEAGEIYAVYVGSSGSSVFSEPVAWDSPTLLSSGAGSQHSPDVACDQNGCIATWVDEQAGNARIVARRMLGADLSRDSIALPIPAPGAVQLEPKVLFPITSGSSYPAEPAWLTWREAVQLPTGLRGLRISYDGTLVDAAPVQLVSTDMLEGSYSIAGSAAQGLLCVWEQPDGNGDIHAALLGKSGESKVADVVIADGPTAQMYPQVAASPEGFRVVWEEPAATSNRLNARSVGVDATLGPTTAVTEGRQTLQPAIASSTKPNLTAAWVEGSPPRMNAVFTRLAFDANSETPSPRVASTRAAEQQGLASIATGDGEYLAIWTEQDLGSGLDAVAYALRVSASGQARGEPVVVPFFGTTLWVGTHYLLIGVERTTTQTTTGTTTHSVIRATRLSRDLTQLDSPAIPVFESDSYLYDPVAAFDGQRTLVIATAESATFIDAEGKLERLTSFDLGCDSWHASLSHGERGFLYVCEKGGSSASAASGYQVQGMLLDASGTPSPLGWIAISDVLRNTLRRPVVTYGGGHYLIVYQDDPLGLGSVRPVAKRLSNDGALEDGTPIIVATEAPSGPSNLPAATFDGTNFLVAWSASYRGFYQTQANFLARISPDGIALDPAGYQLGFPAQHELYVGRARLAALGLGRSVVGYSREDVELGWTARVKLRAFFDDGANGTTCFVDADCSSSHCAAGRCLSPTEIVGQAGSSPGGAAGAAGMNHPAAAGANNGSTAGANNGSTAGATHVEPGAAGSSAGSPNVQATGGRAGASAWPQRRSPRGPSDGEALDGCSCRIGRAQSRAKSPSLPSAWLLLATLGLMCRGPTRTRRANATSPRPRSRGAGS